MENSPVQRSLAEEDNSKSPKKIKLCADREQQMKEEEKSICKLYETIIDEFLIEKEVTHEEIVLALEKIRESFHYGTGHSFGDIDYNKLDYACGYLYRYAPYSAGLSRLSTIKIFEECDEFKNRIKEKKNLKIVSLGGGPGSDMVGFVTAMYDVLKPDNLIKDYTFDIYIVDKVKSWATCITLIVKHLLKEEGFGDASELYKSKSCVNFFFFPHDLNKSSHKYEEFLKDADVIVLARFMSILDWPKKEEFAENLRNHMGKDALLLYIDSTFAMEEDSGIWNGFEIVYIIQELEGDGVQPYQVTQQRHRFNDSGKFTPKPHFVVIMRVKS